MTATVRVSQLVTDAEAWLNHVYGSSTPPDLEIATNEALYEPSSIELKVTPRSTPERSVRIVIPSPVLVSPGWSGVDTEATLVRQRATYMAQKPESGGGISIVVKNGRSTY